MAEPKEPVGQEPTSETGAGASQHEGDTPRFTVVDKRFWVGREEGDNGRETETGAPTSRLPTYLERLQEQLEEKDRLLKTHLAELRNEREELRRRLTRELDQRIDLATGNLLTDFLPVVDNLERALESAAQQSDPKSLLEGIRLVRAQFLNVLERYGLKPLDRLGQPFDPSLDEAVTTVAVTDPDQDNLVLQEWAKGYTLHDKVLRPARVAVGKMVAEDR